MGITSFLKNSNKDVIFRMEFFPNSENINRAFKKEVDYMKLQLIQTESEWRCRGIAGYYLNKLRCFVKDNEFKEIRLEVAPKGKREEKAMDLNQLKIFYKKYLESDPEVKLTCGL